MTVAPTTQPSLPRPAVEVTRLVKTFGATRALDGLDLVVRRGGVHALLGPNGAGKTTLIRILATLVRADAGRARVLGHDVARAADEVRSRIALTGQFASVDPDLTGRENLVLVARLLGHTWRSAKRRTDESLEAFDLTDSAGRQVKTYSGGMRRRLDLAASLVVAPELLFLDEPTTGLDPHHRVELWEMVRRLVGGGTTVLLTTQYLDEADQLADRVAVLDRGRVIADGSTSELKASVGAGSVTVRVRDPERRCDAAELLARTFAQDVHLGRDRAVLQLRASDPDAVARALLDLSRAGVAVCEFAFGQPTLDEVFLTLTGHGADPDAPVEEVA